MEHIIKGAQNSLKTTIFVCEMGKSTVFFGLFTRKQGNLACLALDFQNKVARTSEK